MTFTYNLGTDTGKTRLEIGDVVQQDYSLTDEEIAVALTQNTDLLAVAIRCCEWRLARLSEYVSQSVGGQSTQTNQKYEQTKDTLDRLKTRAMYTFGAVPRAGGIEQSRITAAKQDSEYPQPAFAVGADDYPGTGVRSDDDAEE